MAGSRRAVFLDVDGTLVDYRGRVPRSARSAIEQARSAGHLVFLCTGRSISAIWPEILEVGFDGIVGAAGGYVEVGGTVVTHVNVPVDQVREIVDFFTANGVEFMLESNSGVYASPGAPRRVREQMFGRVAEDDLRAELMRSVGAFLDQLEVDADLVREDINKVIFLGSHLTLDDLRARFGDRFDFVPASIPGFGGEMSIRGVHKAAGIEVVLGHVGIDRADSVAFGDGFNDLEMLAFVGVGVAMGNAPQVVREAADRMTGTPEEDGIREGFLELGLIPDRLI